MWGGVATVCVVCAPFSTVNTHVGNGTETTEIQACVWQGVKAGGSKGVRERAEVCKEMVWHPGSRGR